MYFNVEINLKLFEKITKIMHSALYIQNQVLIDEFSSPYFPVQHSYT